MMLMMARPVHENNGNVNYYSSNPNNLNSPSPSPVNDWTDSLFNCFAQLVPSCVMALWCPCVLLGQISEAVHFAPCACVCMGYCALLLTFIIISAYNYMGFLIIWAISASLVCVVRQQVRKYHFMRQNTFEDGAVSCFCSFCALSQMARHVYRYRSIVDECPCSTDGRTGSASISTVVPVHYGRSAPVHPLSYPVIQQPVVYPNQQTNFSYPHYSIPQQPMHQQSVHSQQYCYDSNGNMIPIAVAVPV